MLVPEAPSLQIGHHRLEAVQHLPSVRFVVRGGPERVDAETAESSPCARSIRVPSLGARIYRCILAGVALVAVAVHLEKSRNEAFEWVANKGKPCQSWKADLPIWGGAMPPGFPEKVLRRAELATFPLKTYTAAIGREAMDNTSVLLASTSSSGGKTPRAQHSRNKPARWRPLRSCASVGGAAWAGDGIISWEVASASAK
eukprot:CAMPEP_0194750504 /NCGR_PEP_ID=MMETSP0323_2-20130528/4570_1 /TAXON_ID=2866 ORGANISM="Crypthecodinium cohnii, Strain Seligo" /NCGR_SAMPLE_ID=MMETSP0323_2 /ASSEMBLY_ACC=CAM_ASM_000346 /LENGTH=199 /DNA_ID=CAMNT_0039666283 /DNA_START=303 /DNA_END=903 /DNA_ORIENTATION=+